MAYTTISNLLVPTVYSDTVNNLLTTNKSALVTSGAVSIDPLLSQFVVDGLSKGGNELITPYFTSFDEDDTNSTGDLTSDITPGSKTEKSTVAPKMFRAFSYGSLNVARFIAAGDPMANAAAEAVRNINKNRQAVILNVLQGVEAAANTVNVSAGTSLATRELSLDVITTAKALFGDVEFTGTLVMHSAVFYQLQKADKTTFERPSATNPFTTFAGINIILDDTMPVTSGTYTTLYLAAGSVRLGTSGVTSVVSVKEEANGGFGAEQLITRRTDAVSPYGYTWSGSAGVANAELVKTANWTLNSDWNIKQTGISFIKTKIV